MAQIVRMTFFKVDVADQDFGLQLVKDMHANNKKDGKPYMISCTGHKLADDPRSNGYNFMIRTRFENQVDHKFYDEECPAHKELKSKWGPKAKAPPMTVYLEA